MAIGLENINALWASLIIDELARCGVDYVCVSPGSRSTPLTIAAARNTGLRKKICYDERAAAFHALGYARATGKPAVLICTSGTAAANYYPAIVEASMDHVPLVVLTADRPPELRGVGANQAIYQTGMYGEYVRQAVELPSPVETIDPRMVLTTVDQLYHRATGPYAGPVHLNCMYREPLAPHAVKMNDTLLQQLADWMVSGRPYTTCYQPVQQTADTDLDDLVSMINAAKNGLVIAGRMDDQEDILAVRDLAAKLGWPVFADILSGCRIHADWNISTYDQMLNVDLVTDVSAPDVVLQFGDAPVSKRLLQWLEKQEPEHYIHIERHPDRIDPAHRVTHRVQVDISGCCRELESRVKGKSKLLAPLSEMNVKARNAIKEILEETPKITEPGVARLTARHIPDDWGLWLASSMPVRDMDMFCQSLPLNVRIAANRGASGIDGTIASATGFSAGLDLPTVLLMGDLAFIHDMNSLDLVKKSGQPLVIVLINNHGGGIFHFLPVAQYPPVFEPWFTTPHHYHFDALARQFNLPYMRCETRADYTRELVKALENRQSVLLEVVTKREENIEFHHDITVRIDESIRYR